MYGESHTHIGVCENYVGTCYRALKIKLAPHVYAEGKTTTWQQFSSATKKQLVTYTFLERDGMKLLGSLFVIHSTKAKQIEELSVIPEEEEVLFGCNSHFRVMRKIEQDAEKKLLLLDLAGYDLLGMDVYELKQL